MCRSRATGGRTVRPKRVPRAELRSDDAEPLEDLATLRRQVADLRDIAARAAHTEATLREQGRAMAERVKELGCLFAISALREDNSLTLNQVLQRIAEMLPPAWQYPDRTSARITLGDRVLTTPGFRQGRWSLTAPVRADGRPIGAIDVCCVESPETPEENPFLPEEEGLLRVIADRVSDVVERKSAEAKVHSYQEQLRSLALQVSLTAERERREIAVSLHDTVGENLVVAEFKLDVLKDSGLPRGATEQVEEVLGILHEILQQTRQLTFDISPPVLYELGLPAAIEWLAERMSQQFGLRVLVDDDGRGGPLSEEIRVVLFRAVRELLYNVVRHAHTAEARVRLMTRQDALEVRVEDDGAGFDVAARAGSPRSGDTFGLFSIRERVRQLGGDFQVESTPGRGTVATIVLISSCPAGRPESVA